MAGRRFRPGPTRARIRTLVGLAAIVLVVTVLGPGGAGAAPGDVGYPGRSYSGAGAEPVGSKPESKLWWNDGSWWASMWDSASGDYHIFRLDAATHSWVDTGVPLDTRSNTRADTLWDGSRLYVASHVFNTTSSSGYPARLFRYSYNPASRTYVLDSGFPVAINNYRTETLVIDKDSTGRLWATWVQGTSVYVSHTLADDRAWATPFVLPVSGATALKSDDISSLVAFGGSKVGVMWSNQTTQTVNFAVHLDGQPPGTWRATETALSGAGSADDHVNLKAAADGRVFAAVKTSQTLSSAPLGLVLVRGPTGGWTQHPFGVVSEKHGRPILLLDEASRRIHVFATSPETGGTVYEKTSSLDAVSFPPGAGTPFLRNVASATMNNPTSTKGGVDGRTGLVVLGGHNASSTYWHNEAALPVAPEPGLAADFTGAPTSGPAPLTVAFADASHGAATSWSWDFGDGTTSSERNPVHTYRTAGDFTVTLTVEDAAGKTSTRTRPAYVSSLPLTADFTGMPTSGRVPHTVNFSDRTSGAPTSWSWDFGDGTSSSERNPSHLYTQAGTYTVSLTVGDAAGATSTRTQTAYVTVQPLTAGFTGTPLSGRVPLAVTFKDATLGTPTSWSWDFGDGTTSSERSPVHTYVRAGTYTVALTAADAYGNTSTATRTAYVTVLPLTADFSGTPTRGAAPLAVAFKDATLGTPTTWRWDFGDGTTSSERSPIHTYAAVGAYTVTLTVTDAYGNTSTKTRVDYVSALPLTADFGASPTSGSAPLPVAFTDTSVGTPTSWMWDFGDGTTSSERSPVHTYARPGDYTVTLTVENARGERSTKTRDAYVVASPDVVVKPAADAYVRSLSATTNFGGAASVRVKNGGTSSTAEHYRAYFRFSVPTLPGPVTAAKLRLYVTDPSTDGGHLYAVDGAWTESGLTWNNAPAIGGSALGWAGAVALNTWVEIPVPASVFASGGGTYGFGLKQTPVAGSAYYGTRETANAPQLVLTVDWGPSNQAPLARADTSAGDEDAVQLVDVLANDDPGPADEAAQALRLEAITAGPAHGTAEIVAGGIRYAPAPDYNGPDGLDYRVCDAGAPSLCVTARLDVSVAPVNDAPYAAADVSTGREDAEQRIDVRANDLPGPADEAGQALTLDAITTAPASGTAELAVDALGGTTIRYVPASDSNGGDRFEYRVCDDGVPTACSTASVDVMVDPVNDPPVAAADAFAVDTDGTRVVDVLANDAGGPADEVGQELTFEGVTVDAAHGRAEAVDAGKVRYTPGSRYFGSDAFVYRICDDAEPRLCSTGRATIRLGISATAETAPIPHAGSAADDPAVWLHPTDPTQSTVIATDKLGGLAVYDLSGDQIQFRADGRMNNVDLRSEFPLAGDSVALVGASNRSGGSIALYRVDPASRGLEPVAARVVSTSWTPYGFCLYRSASSGKTYAFVTRRVDGVTPPDESDIEQWELFDDGSGKVDARLVRGLRIGTRSEGCVADDELGDFYVGNGDTGIWKLSAEPDGGDQRVLVDAIGDSGQLEDVEGLTLVSGANGSGFLIASNAGESSLVVYRREGENDHVRTLQVHEGEGVDGLEATEGIHATAAGLGPRFPQGVLVAQDAVNGLDNQNFKLVPLERVLAAEPEEPGSCARPYADASPWNTPIGTDAAYEPDSDFHLAALQGLLTSDPEQYTYPVYEVTGATPRETVTVSGWFSNVTEDGTVLLNQRGGAVDLPVPPGAVAAAGADAQIVLVDPVTGDEWGASNLERDASGNLIAWNAYHYDTGWSGVPPRDASDRPFFLRGAGVPYLAGLVRPCEIARGRVEHALAFAYDYPTEAYVYPATKSDGKGIEPGDMPEGTRLQLDPRLTAAQIRAWGCTGPCLTIARALQRYGMYIVDNSARPKVSIEFESTAVWDGRIHESTLEAIPFSAFKVLDLPGE